MKREMTVEEVGGFGRLVDMGMQDGYEARWRAVNSAGVVLRDLPLLVELAFPFIGPDLKVYQREEVEYEPYLLAPAPPPLADVVASVGLLLRPDQDEWLARSLDALTVLPASTAAAGLAIPLDVACALLLKLASSGYGTFGLNIHQSGGTTFIETLHDLPDGPVWAADVALSIA